jgi:hypothetical protein
MEAIVLIQFKIELGIKGGLFQNIVKFPPLSVKQFFLLKGKFYIEIFDFDNVLINNTVPISRFIFRVYFESVTLINP